MAKWAVIFKDTDEMLGIRADKSRRDAHVAFAIAHPELLIGGGLKPEPEADFCGALWVVEAESRKDVEMLIQADPFYVPQFRTYEIFLWGRILEDRVVEI